MNVASLIAAKRDGQVLSTEQIEFLVQGYATGKIPDYQMSAFAMAVYFRGMTSEETVALTQCFIDSGIRVSWPAGPPTVDKHSTGGIGDKTSIPLAPMLACCGTRVPMISGRGLGATGGTLDKLESIPGFRCDMSVDEFRSVVNWNGCAIVSASPELAPADKRMYSLRDVTGTVPSIPLITASILSKKVAEGIDALILDVKWGTGAFMKSLDEARQLARSLVDVGNQMGVRTTAMVTDMNQPLGKMIGNAVEIDESVAILRGQGPPDVTQLTIELGVQALLNAGVETERDAAREQLQQTINLGTALEKLGEMISSQDGDLSAPRELANHHVVTANDQGFVCRVDAERLGLAVIEMGGGRSQLDQQIDHSVGIEFLVRVGDAVQPDQPIANLFCHTPQVEYATSLIRSAVFVSPDRVDPPELIVEWVE